MFSLGREMRYWLYSEPTDMRKSFHTLCGLVRNKIGGDPMNGDVYILSRYVNDGRFCIDNNLVENAIRPLALGRKNYLFCGNHDAAVRAAIVYSLVDSCKALDVNPREWMEDVLLRIPGNENNREALRELLPDKWAKQTK